MVRINANSSIYATSTQTRDSYNQNLSVRTTSTRENIMHMTKSEQCNNPCTIFDMCIYIKQSVTRDTSSSERTRIVHTKSEDTTQEIEI